MQQQRFRKLDVWVKALDFIEQIYKVTNKFPRNESFGLISQVQRAALSVALNIAE